VILKSKDSKLGSDSVVIAAQLYALDRHKFLEPVSKVNREIMERVENGMMLVLGITKSDINNRYNDGVPSREYSGYQ
jgi:mRNA-degrading endonuclease toxin of MazEF toxin-antitoxin module